MKSLQEVYKKYKTNFAGGGDKGVIHSYIDVYESQMNRKHGINLLEIGVRNGHSIAMWKEYFSESDVHGIDIKIWKLAFDVSENIHICDATNSEQIEKTFGSMMFDYIIDDGSHVLEDQINSFEILWPRIKQAGKYFIEDVQGENELESIKNCLISKNVSFEVFDLRSIKNRYDDILLVVTKK